jgi:hypothetical protein
MIKQEDTDRRNNPDQQGGKHCDRPPGYGADPSCYPSLPGMPRDADDGDILCYSWREGQQQCTYEQIGSQEKNIYQQQADAMKELNACALLIPGCWQSLQFLFSMYGAQDTNDPEAMADQAEQFAMQGRLSTLMRYLRQLRKVNLKKACGVAGNSFRGDTPVVLADGRLKPIDRITVGERVLATDPITGRTRARPVTAVNRHDDTEFTDLTVRDRHGRESTVHTTPGHPVWDASASAWTGAGALPLGDSLRALGAGTVTVAGLRSFAGHQAMYNLSVADLHTFYVMAGGTAILVHNDDYNQALNKALAWLEQRGFKAEKPTIGKFGSIQGKPVGMQTADGKTGFRIEFDDRSGAHINVFSGKEKGPHFQFDATEVTVTKIQSKFGCS